jgi:hypothetical protein
MNSPDNPFLAEMCRELARAEAMHPRFNSHHEAYAVLLEELDEFWDECRKQSHARDLRDSRRELIQIATVAWKAARSLGIEEFGF